jgi:cytochrome c-type biogenesis protein CcmH
MSALLFPALALVLASGATGVILAGFHRAGRPSLAPLQRHLAEVDGQRSAGLISREEHRRARAVVGRRLLAAADEAELGGLAGARAPGWLRALALLTPVLAVAGYLVVGAPGLADQPYRTRLEAWRNTEPSQLQPDEIAAVLADIAQQRPQDPEPLKHLARVRRAGGDDAGAIQALRKAITLAPQRADLWADLGEALVVQAKGEVSPEARWAFEEALQRAPDNASARFHLSRAASVADAGDRSW